MLVWVYRLAWLFLFVLLCTTTVPAQQSPTRTPQPRGARAMPQLTATEADAVSYVHQSIKLRFPYRLNLADERQYTYVMAMLRLAGDSPQRSPQLYKNLAAARGSGTAGPPQLAMGTGTTAVGDGTTLITPINLIQYLFDNGTAATSSLLSSVPGGTDNTTMMVNYRVAGQPQPFAFSPTYKQSAGGKQFIQNYTANLPNNTPDGTVIASSLILTSKGGNITPYTMAVDDTPVNATSICSTAPNYGVKQTPPIQCPAVGASCVNQGTITPPIVECYGRNTGPGTDCNYIWPGSGYPPSMTLNIAGSMTFPNPIDPALQGAYVLNLQRGDGGCFLPPGGGEPTSLSSQNFSISPTNPNVLNFCFAGAQLPNSGCLTAVATNVFLDLTVYVTQDISGGGTNIGMGKISSNGTINPNQPWFAQVPVITVMQGCFAPGTEITLADGTPRKVELFKADGTEQVLLNRNGTKGLVRGTGDGVETNPLIRITDSAGNTVVVTETHAIVTGKGPKLAWQVRVGDTLYTRKGTSRVTKVEAVPVPAGTPQKVHNLFIGDEAQAAAGKTTMFANGILVGDMYMQNEVFKRAQRQGFSRAEVLSRLPKEWHQDYLNSLANGTNRR